MDTTESLRWKDGRKFSRKVSVYAFPNGIPKYLFSVHREEALRMCNAGSVVPPPRSETPDNLITCVEIGQTPGVALGPATKLTLNSYTGLAPVYKERLGPRDAYAGHKTWTLRKASTLVLPALLLCLLGCSVPHTRPLTLREVRGVVTLARGSADVVRIAREWDGWYVYDQREANYNTPGPVVCGPYSYVQAMQCARRQAEK